MTLVYYNSIMDSYLIIESDKAASAAMKYALAVNHKNNGWICLGEL